MQERAPCKKQTLKFQSIIPQIKHEPRYEQGMGHWFTAFLNHQLEATFWCIDLRQTAGTDRMSCCIEMEKTLQYLWITAHQSLGAQI